MTQKELNSKIAMSLLMQAAWVWETCTQNVHEGEFKLSEVVQGHKGRNRTNAKPGMVFVDLVWCEYWNVFNTDGHIEGLTYNAKTYEAVMEFGTFRCAYHMANVFSVALAFCRMNGCSAMMNKTVFGYKDGERWCRLPEKVSPKSAPRKVTQKAQKAQKVSAISAGQKEMTLADKLRAALRERLAA